LAGLIDSVKQQQHRERRGEGKKLKVNDRNCRKKKKVLLKNERGRGGPKNVERA